jgi:hypothetical protein
MSGTSPAGLIRRVECETRRYLRTECRNHVAGDTLLGLAGHRQGNYAAVR